MSVSVSMPQLGESVTEGTVTRWLKKEGERVEVDEPLLEVSTDKVDTEIPSPASGILRGIAVDEDETVAVGAQLAVIEDSESGDAAPPADDSASAEAAELSQPEASQPEAAANPRQRSRSGSRHPARMAGVRSPTMRRPHRPPGLPRRGSQARPDRRRPPTLPRPPTLRRPRTASPEPPPYASSAPTYSHPAPSAHLRPARCPGRPGARARPAVPGRAGPGRLVRLLGFAAASGPPAPPTPRSTRRPRRCRLASRRPTSPRWSASSPPSTP